MNERDLIMGECNNRRQWNMKVGRRRQTFWTRAIYTEWPKKMYTLFTHQYLWNKLWQCLDADGGHFKHLHWIQNSRTSLISILLLYKYSSYDYRVIFFMSKCVYIILGHSVYNVIFVFMGCLLYFMSQNLVVILSFFFLLQTWPYLLINFILHTSLYFLKISYMLVLVYVYILWSMFMFLSYKFRFHSNDFSVCMFWKWSGRDIVITLQAVKCRMRLPCGDISLCR
jgi:hypothetical protein